MAHDVLEEVCKLQRMATPLFVINFTLFVLLLAAFPFLERGSATYYVSLLSFGIIGGTLLLWSALKYKCRQIDEKNGGFLERESER
jgi:hypothetical protein